MSNFDIESYVAQHREEFRAAFHNPELNLLATRIGKKPPKRVTDFYSLGDALAVIPTISPTSFGDISIQNFVPLTKEVVAA